MDKTKLSTIYDEYEIEEFWYRIEIGDGLSKPIAKESSFPSFDDAVDYANRLLRRYDRTYRILSIKEVDPYDLG
jgi:hypothetical protein